MILELFLEADHALMLEDIKKRCVDVGNYINIYRTLQNFLKKDIIHIVPTNDNTIKYSFSLTELKKQNNLKKHIHFACIKCNETTCINGVNVPKIKLPKGFKMWNCEILITGICSNCKRKTRRKSV